MTSTHIILDAEVYSNFFILGCYWLAEKRYVALGVNDMPKFGKYLDAKSPVLITFNGLHYDTRILSYALDNHNDIDILKVLKRFSDYIILDPKEKETHFDRHRWWRRTPQIDLKQVLGGRICPSLKKLACRLFLPEVESLPIPPDKRLTESEKELLIKYNKLDCLNTKYLYDKCKTVLDLRRNLTQVYGIDCLSLSDAQISERVICRSMRGEPEPMDEYPRPLKALLHNFHFDNLTLNSFFSKVQKSYVKFVQKFDPMKGKPIFQKFFLIEGKQEKEVNIQISPPASFRMGGLHSIHKRIPCRGDQAFEVDAASFYPNLILRFSIYPEGVGQRFLEVYKEILEKRLQAKRDGRKIEADSLKIVLNATFGKFNEFYSKLRDPVCGVSVCLHGELCILRLMDLCYESGVEIIMVNTDGIVCKQNPAGAVAAWEQEFAMPLETKEIKKYFVKDSNNLILRYSDGSLKVKGIAFAYEPTISKQTNFPIVQRAIVNYLMDDIPLEETIKNGTNIYEYLGVYVKGPTILELCSFEGEQKKSAMPNLVRWYIGHSGLHLKRRNVKTWTTISDSHDFVLANKVEGFPVDLNFTAYVKMASKKLEKLCRN